MRHGPNRVKCEHGHVTIFRECSNRGIEVADPSRPFCALFRSILDDENIGRVLTEYLRDAREAPSPFLRPARLAYSPIERCLSDLRTG